MSGDEPTSEAERLAAGLEALLEGDAREALSLCAGASPPPRPSRVGRWLARRSLELVREREDPATLPELEAALVGLDLTPYPDLERAFERLRVGARDGPRLEAMVGDPSLDRHLLLGVRFLLGTPPAVAAALRQRVLDQDADGMEDGAAGQTLVALRRELPDVARLEAPFLASAAPRRDRRSASWQRWALVALAAFVVYRWGALIYRAWVGP